jgi:NAD(P)-dependent dehydrogenase (short-subunit alcohol dehydrogenase family)
VLTGGTGGLGRELARRLADRDYLLAVTYLGPDEGTDVETSLALPEDRALFRRVDCSDPDAVNEFIDEVGNRFGGINVLAALVGGWLGGKDVDDTDDVRLERMLDLNLRTAFFAARAALPWLRRADWGRIIMVGSRAAVEPVAGQAAYNMAKAGVIALARTIAQEAGEDGVTANAVLPSVIDTPAFRGAVPFADYVGWPTPGQIAEVIEFLASPDSEVINGAMIPVYGNM